MTGEVLTQCPALLSSGSGTLPTVIPRVGQHRRCLPPRLVGSVRLASSIVGVTDLDQGAGDVVSMADSDQELEMLTRTARGGGAVAESVMDVCEAVEGVDHGVGVA